MAIFKIERNRNYTVMANYHLRDKNLSNKARGLLSTMLSLPDEWDYTVRGLAAICKDGKDSIKLYDSFTEKYGLKRIELFFLRKCGNVLNRPRTQEITVP